MFSPIPASIFLRPYGTLFMGGDIFPGVETYGLYSTVPAGLIVYFYFRFQTEFPDRFTKHI